MPSDPNYEFNNILDKSIFINHKSKGLKDKLLQKKLVQFNHFIKNMF